MPLTAAMGKVPYEDFSESACDVPKKVSGSGDELAPNFRGEREIAIACTKPASTAEISPTYERVTDPTRPKRATAIAKT